MSSGLTYATGNHFDEPLRFRRHFYVAVQNGNGLDVSAVHRQVGASVRFHDCAVQADARKNTPAA